jgi:hypothetical protein
MTEIERVRALRDAGQITAEEADRLIGVLRELDGDAAGSAGRVDAGAPRGAGAPSRSAGRVEPAPPIAAAVGTATDRPGMPPAPPVPPTPPMPPAPPMPPVPPAPPTSPVPPTPELPGVPPVETPEGPDAPPAPDPAAPETAAALEVPDGTRWCRIELLAADLTVRADDVAEPTIDENEGHFVLTPTDDGLRITARREHTLEGWIGRMRALDVSVRLPRSWGLLLDLKAGDADVRDVPYVRGRMLAGDLDIRNAEAVDLTKGAGDLAIAFRPTRGRHRIVSKAGDLDVTFLPGSQATVEGSVAMGDLDAPGFAVERRTIGGTARGRFGSGAARVEVRLSAGDLNLRAPRSEG